MDNCNTQVNNRDGQEEQKSITPDVSLISTKSRAFFACKSDEKVVECLSDTCSSRIYSIIDARLFCPICKSWIETGNVLPKHRRSVKLNTLHHGSLSIFITDIHCPKYERFIA